MARTTAPTKGIAACRSSRFHQGRPSRATAAATSAATLPLGSRSVTQIRWDRCDRCRTHDDREDVSRRARPPAFRQLELGERVASGRERLGSDQEDEQVACSDGLPDLIVVRLTGLEGRAIEEDGMTLASQGDLDAAGDILLLRSVREKHLHGVPRHRTIRFLMADGPFFISYSRRDYYFAESLALHLMRRGVPVWLDVKDLDPGGLWEQDLDAALDRASAVILVVSPDSMKTVNVRNEWVRARDRGKRIVIAYVRRAQLPPELADCEAVDFRGSFMPSLDDLVSLLSRPSTASPHHGLPYPALPRLPLTILLLLVALAVPTAGYFLLADWNFPANQSAFENVLTIAVIPIGLCLMVWFFCVSLLSRRMGMTRLATCLVLLGTFYVLPLAMSWFGS